MEPWRKSIDKLKQLFKEHNHPEDWSDNIIKASRNLSSKRDWSLFYSYLSNPKEFDPTKQIVTLDDLIKLPEIEPYPSNVKITEYKNGIETHIHVTIDNYSDDEKEV